jgi:hypothetical protein
MIVIQRTRKKGHLLSKIRRQWYVLYKALGNNSTVSQSETLRRKETCFENIESTYRLLTNPNTRIRVEGEAGLYKLVDGKVVKEEATEV